MHELGIVEGWLSAAREAAGERRVKRLKVSVGELAGVDLEALEFAFEAVAPRFLRREGAQLEIRRVPGRLRCGGPEGCGTEFAFAEHGATCPRCGGVEVEWLSGLELRLDSLTVEEESDHV